MLSNAELEALTADQYLEYFRDPANKAQFDAMDDGTPAEEILPAPTPEEPKAEEKTDQTATEPGA